MPRYIVKLDGKYLEWSSVVDAPVTFGMSLEEFKAYYQDAYGRGDPSAASHLESRLERVEATGTSSHVHESADDVIAFNRAGRGETLLMKQQIIDYYVHRKGDGIPQGVPIELEDEDA